MKLPFVIVVFFFMNVGYAVMMDMFMRIDIHTSLRKITSYYWAMTPLEYGVFVFFSALVLVNIAMNMFKRKDSPKP